MSRSSLSRHGASLARLMIALLMALAVAGAVRIGAAQPTTSSPTPRTLTERLLPGVSSVLTVSTSSGTLSVTVHNTSEQFAVVRLSGAPTGTAQQPGTLTIEVPPSLAVDVTSTADIHQPDGVRCTTDKEPSRLSCPVTGGASIQFGVTPDPERPSDPAFPVRDPVLASPARIETDRESYSSGQPVTVTITNDGTEPIAGANATCGALRFLRRINDGWSQIPLPTNVQGQVACRPVVLTLEPGASRTEMVRASVQPGEYRLAQISSIVGGVSDLIAYSRLFTVTAMPPPFGAPSVATELTCTAPENDIFPPGGRLSATLRDQDGNPVAGKTITWAAENFPFGLSDRMPVTNAEGTVTTDVRVPFDVGIARELEVTATFAGDQTYIPSSCRMMVRIVSPGLPMPPGR